MEVVKNIVGTVKDDDDKRVFNLIESNGVTYTLNDYPIWYNIKKN